MNAKASHRKDLISYLGILVLIQLVGIGLIFIFRGFFRVNPIGIIIMAFLLGIVAPIVLGFVFYDLFGKGQKILK
jgi:RsiW-degrading membrane proteinase PrsW (M82 family)